MKVLTHTLLNDLTETWCGYIIADQELTEEQESILDENFHGGITFREAMDGQWTYGFDCSHFTDGAPGMAKLLDGLGELHSPDRAFFPYGIFRTREWVQDILDVCVMELDLTSDQNVDGNAN